MRTADFDYHLPPKRIAQVPAAERDQSRLLVLHRDSGRIEHQRFRDLLEYLFPGDVLVLNDSRVIPARLRGINARTGGQFELLLLEENACNDWWAMLRPGKRARVGTQILVPNRTGGASVMATVVEKNDEGHGRLHFNLDIKDLLVEVGEVPLPPYIERPDSSQATLDRDRYQTVYAQSKGSVAAPTAGLHFTELLLDQIRARGVQVCFLTLHVGLGTFAPVKSETLSGHTMHEECYSINEETVEAITRAKRERRRIVAVGTTSLRVLESMAQAHDGRLVAGSGRTRLFVFPPFDFQIVDALLTNFHLPRSTLLMLVSAFAAPNETRGREMILSAYQQATRQRYRFFSYGDAMFIA